MRSSGNGGGSGIHGDGDCVGSGVVVTCAISEGVRSDIKASSGGAGSSWRKGCGVN